MSNPTTSLPSGRVCEIFVDVYEVWQQDTPDDISYGWTLSTTDRTGGISWELEQPYTLENGWDKNPDLVYADGLQAAMRAVTGLDPRTRGY